MKQNVKIRAAEEKDAQLLTELARETFHDAFAGHPFMARDDLRLYMKSAFTVSQITSELNDPKTIFFLAEIEGEAVGYAKLERGVTTEGVTGTNPIKLKRLYNRQKFIGFGIGASLMNHCLKESAKLEHDTIWLTVWQHNLLAQNFYHKWDFEECGAFDFQLGETVCIDKVLQRQVLLEVC